MKPRVHAGIVAYVTSSLFCPVCGDVMGVYEPLVVVGIGGTRITSVAREPSLCSSDELVMHLGCGSDRSGDRDGAPATAGPYQEC